MTTRLVVALAASSFVADAAVLRHLQNKPGSGHHKSAESEQEAYRQPMRNIGDAQYTGEMNVGGQVLNAVYDTGSFELLVLSKNCSLCGKKSHLFDEKRSKSYKGSEFKAQHTFGSGTTNSIEAYDQIDIGHFKAEGQVFWEVYDADMSILLEDSFQAILGVGPPSSAIKFAQEDAEEVHDELSEFEKKGHEITVKIKDTVQHYDDLLVHAQDAVSVVENLGVSNMSVCLGRESMSEGYMIWNDHASRDYPDRFTKVEVVGDYYWSAEMTDAKLSGEWNTSKELTFKPKHLGCKNEKCSAVIDSGTTLIVAPQEVVDSINDAMDAFMEKGGSCDDISQLPDLEFKLGGQDFSLPPESYVGKISGDMGAIAQKYLPHIYKRTRGESRWGDCETLLMTMDMDTQVGPSWILGMPFFRKYYTSFEFINSKDGEPEAKNMYVSVADSNCEPSSPDDDAGVLIASQDRESRARAVLNVDASKIRVPRLMQRAELAKAKSGHLSDGAPFVRI